MAHIFVKNSLNISKAAKMDVNFPIYVTTDSEGDPIWLLEVATTYPSASGTDIKPVYIDKVTSYEDLDDAVAKAVSDISKQIDWLPLEEDNEPPYINDYCPEGENTSIFSNVYINIKENAPSAGIDLSDTKVILNNGVFDFDITEECFISGNPFEYEIRWLPNFRYLKHYNEE